MTEKATCLIKPSELGSGKRFQLEVIADDDTHFAIVDLELVVTSDGSSGEIELKIISDEHLVECSEIAS